MASMPQLVKLQEELADSGFMIVAPHSQAGTREEVTKVVEKNRVNYLITAQAQIEGEPVSGLPMMFLFDSQGNLVQKDHHISHGAIRSLVQSEPHFLAAGRTYKKHQATADLLKKTKAYGAILKKLKKDLSGTGDAADEAKFLTERITAFGKKQLETAKGLETQDAYKAYSSYSELSGNWKGSDIGDSAAARLKELKSDKPFQEELKASQIAAQIHEDLQKLVEVRGTVNLTSPVNQKVVLGARQKYELLKKKYPESKALAQIKGEMSSKGIKGVD